MFYQSRIPFLETDMAFRQDTYLLFTPLQLVSPSATFPLIPIPFGRLELSNPWGMGETLPKDLEISWSQFDYTNTVQRNIRRSLRGFLKIRFRTSASVKGTKMQAFRFFFLN